jgi:plastocyanin
MPRSRSLTLAATAPLVALLAVTGCSKAADTTAPTTTPGSTAGTTPTTPAVKTPGTTATTESGTTPGTAPGKTGGSTPVSGSGTTVATAPNQVTIADFVFTPATLEVAAGTNVVWLNNDEFDHYIISEDKTTLDSDAFGQGATYQHTFAAPGTYEYYCNIHNQMKGTIVVS